MNRSASAARSARSSSVPLRAFGSNAASPRPRNRAQVLQLISSTVHLSEAIRFAAMTTALGSPVRLLFLADGVRGLARGQEAHLLAPPIGRMLSGIVTDTAPALVHAPSLAARGLDRADLVDGVPVELLDDAGAAGWVRHARRVVPF